MSIEKFKSVAEMERDKLRCGLWPLRASRLYIPRPKRADVSFFACVSKVDRHITMIGAMGVCIVAWIVKHVSPSAAVYSETPMFGPVCQCTIRKRSHCIEERESTVL